MTTLTTSMREVLQADFLAIKSPEQEAATIAMIDKVKNGDYVMAWDYDHAKKLEALIRERRLIAPVLQAGLGKPLTIPPGVKVHYDEYTKYEILKRSLDNFDKLFK